MIRLNDKGFILPFCFFVLKDEDDKLSPSNLETS